MSAATFASRAIDCNNNIDSNSCSIQYSISGVQGTYTGAINEQGKPHGNGSFIRENYSLTYVGQWENGKRVGNGGYFATNGRLVGNVVWD